MRMPLVINTNMAAVVASNHLASSNAAVQKSMDRMSTGKRIVLLPMMQGAWAYPPLSILACKDRFGYAGT